MKSSQDSHPFFSAGKTVLYSKKLKGGTEQLEATEKSDIFKHPLPCAGGGRFVFAPAALLREQKCNGHGATSGGGHPGRNGDCG